MFGRKNKEEMEYTHVELTDNMIFPQKSLLTDMLMYESEDGSVRYQQSDITLMKEIGNNPNISPEIAEELRLRNTLRESSPANNLTDREILSSTKSRYTQSLVELQRFSEFLDKQISDTLDADAKETLRTKYEAFLKGESTEPVVEPSNPE